MVTMNIKILVTMLACVFISQQSIWGELTLSAPLKTTVIQLHEETLSIKGNHPDWGGKFKIIEKRIIKNNLSIDDISKDGNNGLKFNLTIKLRNINENVEISPKLEDDDSCDFLNKEIRTLFNIPIQANFSGRMTLNDSSLDEYYLLFDLGLEFYFRTIFIPIGKKLEVGKTLMQEFFLRPDDIADAVTDEDDTVPLEFNDQLCGWNKDDEYHENLDDVEPILLIKYTITKITDSAVFADISGGLVTASPSPSMKPSFKISGKGIWQRANPMVNEISYDFNYSEKRKYSTITLKGFRKTKSFLP
jgi:hypothetical protein